MEIEAFGNFLVGTNSSRWLLLNSPIGRATDIEVCLAAHNKKLYHSGFRGPVKRSTLADAGEKRDWRIYADFAQTLIHIARPLYADTDLGLDLDATVYALDATTIDLCLSLFPWARFRRAKGAVKLRTMIDLQGAIPVFIDIR